MKKKDMITLMIAIAILAIIGLLVYAKYGSKGKDNGVTSVEVIDPISSDFDQGALNTLADHTQVVNFQPAIDLSNLGNAAPFGPLH